MQQIFRAAILLVLWASITFLGIQIANHSKIQKGLPAPTEEGKEEGEGHANKLKRQAWIENMHRIAPGTSWQAIDQQTRIQRQAHSRAGIDTLAGGAIHGFWKETGSINQAGRVHQTDPDYSTNTIYAASSGGIVWKSPMVGDNWTPLNDRLKIPDISKLKKIGNRIVVVSSAYGVIPVHYTDNEGATWQLASGLNSLQGGANYTTRTVVANDTAHTIYFLAREGNSTALYKSVNRGTSFSRIKNYPNARYNGVEYFDLWTAPNGSGTVYLYQNDSVFFFGANSTINFISKVRASNTNNALLSGAEIGGNTYLYLATSDNGTTDFYTSPDGGNIWTNAGSVANFPFGRNSFDASQSVPNKIYFGAVNCSVSYDAGASWNDVNDWSDYYGDPDGKLHADIDGIQSMMDPAGNEVVYVSTDGGLYRSMDGLESVKNLSLTTLRVGQYYSTYTSSTNPEVIYAGSQDQGMQIARNYNTGVRNFEQAISGDYGHIVSSNGGATMWSVYPGFVIYYPDALNNNDIVTWDFIATNGLWLPPLTADPDDLNSVYLGGGSTTTGSHLFHLTYDGSAINYTEGTYDFSGANNSRVSAFAISPINHQYQYVLNEFGDFYYSTDGGANWTMNNNFNGPGSHYFYGSSITPSAKTLGTVYIGGSGYTNPAAYVTTDHGQNFTAINNGLPPTLIYEMAINTDENQLYAATEVGPYVYIATDNKWYDLTGSTVPDQTYWTVDFVPELNTVRFGTYGRGIWDLVLCDSNTVKPVPQFTYAASANGATVSFVNQTVGLMDYHWDFGNGKTSALKDPIMRYDSSGIFHVTLTATNGCSTDSFSADIQVVRTGINQLDVVTIQLFPNPNQGKFLVTAVGTAIETVTVFDLAGKVISSADNLHTASYAVDISGNNAGMYLVAVEAKDQPRKVFKVILQ